MCILSDCGFSSHAPGPVPDHKYKVLYTGNDLALLKHLQEKLKDCFLVRAPTAYVARVLIAGETDYSLFLFDEELPDTTATELESYTRARRESTPVIILKPSDTFGSLVKAITRSLSTRVRIRR